MTCLVDASGVMQQRQFPIGKAHRDEISCLHDALGTSADPPVLHVKRDPEILTNHHAWSHDFNGTSAIRQDFSR